MKIKKRVLALLVVFALVLTGLVGCGKASETDETTTKKNEAVQSDKVEKVEKSVEITFWDMVWGPKEAIETGTALVEKFNATQNKIKVTYQSIPWNNWYQTFATAIASGTAPDISTGAGYQPFQFAVTGAILPIDDVVAEIKSSGDAEDFIGNVIEPLKYKGHYIGLPWSFDGRIMWYRQDLFEAAGIEAPPKNFKEFREYAKKLTKNGSYGFALAGADGSGWQAVLSFMLNNGGGLFDTDGNPDLLNDRNIETLSLFSDMVKVDKSINSACISYKADDMSKIFSSGGAAMMIFNPGIEGTIPELKGKMAVMPALEGYHGDKGSLFWNVSLMLYSQTKYPDETKEFLKWWSKNMKEYWTEGHVSVLPVRKSIADDPYISSNPNVKLVYDEYLPIFKSTGANAPSLFPELNEVEGDGFLNNMVQKVLLGEDPQKVLAEAQVSLEKIMSTPK